MPLSETLCGLPLALSVMLSIPLREPLSVGLKVTLMVQLAPVPTEVPQVSDSAKSPLVVMPVMLSVALPVLARVTGCDALVVPTVWVAKVRLVGLRLTDGMAGGGLPPPPPPQDDCTATRHNAIATALQAANRTLAAGLVPHWAPHLAPIHPSGINTRALHHKAAGIAPGRWASGNHGRRRCRGAASGSAAALPVVEMVSIDWAGDDPGVTVAGLKEQLAPAGKVELAHASVTALLNAPTCGVTVTVKVADSPAFTVPEPGAVGAAATEKLVTTT